MPQTDLKIFVIDGASVNPTRLAMVLKFCEGSSSMMRFTSFTLSSFSQALKFWFCTLLRYCEKRRLLRHICSATLLTVSPSARYGRSPLFTQRSMMTEIGSPSLLSVAGSSPLSSPLAAASVCCSSLLVSALPKALPRFR